MGWSINPIDALKDAGSHIVNGAKDFGDKLVSAGKNTIDHATQIPGQVVGAAAHVVNDPVDAARDAGRAALRETVEAADKVLPDGAVNVALGAVEAGIDGGARVANAIAPDNKYVQYIQTLSRVDLQAFTRTSDLNAPWTSLYQVWAFEETPAWLGQWNENKDTVTITDPRFTGDLASREHQQAVRTEFFKENPNPKVGDTLTVEWLYTGSGASEQGLPYKLEKGEDGKLYATGGTYTALESYLGSYQTTVTCTGVDPKTGEVQLAFTVTNNSHWQSGTRVPQTAQDALGLGEYIIADQPRDTGIGIGGSFTQKFEWTEKVSPASIANTGAAPAEVQTGTRTYYQERYDDFVRHNPGMQPPDYYLEYGNKYAQRFSDLGPNDLSPEGLAWRDRTLKALQEAIETKRREDPKGFAELERDPEAFKSFAYATHADAYVQSGLFDLSAQDLTTIAMTPDIGDILSADGIKGWADTIVQLRPGDIVDIGKATVSEAWNKLPGR